MTTSDEVRNSRRLIARRRALGLGGTVGLGAVLAASGASGTVTGRTAHVHVRVYVDQQTVLTSQLFFDDDLSERVYAAAPYSDHTGRDTFNDGDSIYTDAGLLTAEADGDGWLGHANLGV